MNKLRVFFAVLFTVLSLSHSKPSQAVVGTGGGAAIAGLALMGGGFISLRKCNDLGCLPIGTVLFLAGIIILDGEQQIEFRELTNEEARRIGLSPAEQESYNSELDQTNSILSEVSAELTELSKAEDAARIWEGHRDLINPLTYAAIKKIAAQK